MANNDDTFTLGSSTSEKGADPNKEKQEDSQTEKQDLPFTGASGLTKQFKEGVSSQAKDDEKQENDKNVEKPKLKLTLASDNGGGTTVGENTVINDDEKVEANQTARQSKNKPLETLPLAANTSDNSVLTSDTEAEEEKAKTVDTESVEKTKSSQTDMSEVEKSSTEIGEPVEVVAETKSVDNSNDSSPTGSVTDSNEADLEAPNLESKPESPVEPKADTDSADKSGDTVSTGVVEPEAKETNSEVPSSESQPESPVEPVTKTETVDSSDDVQSTEAVTDTKDANLEVPNLESKPESSDSSPAESTPESKKTEVTDLKDSDEVSENCPVENEVMPALAADQSPNINSSKKEGLTDGSSVEKIAANMEASSNTITNANEEKVSENVPAEDAESIGFWHVIKDSIELFKKKPFSFVGNSFLFMVLLIALIALFSLVLLPLIQNGGVVAIIVSLLYLFLFIFLPYLFFATVSHQTAALLTHDDVKLTTSLQAAFSSIGKAFELLIRVFVYTGYWILLLLIGVFALLGPLSSVLGSLVLILMVIIPILMGVVSLIASIKSLRTVFVLPILMTDPEISASDCLNKSIEMSKGKWWLILFFLAFYSFLITAIPAVLGVLVAYINQPVISMVAGLLMFVYFLAFYPLFVIFVQTLGDKLIFNKTALKLNKIVVTIVVLLFLSPTIAAWTLSSWISEMMPSSVNNTNTEYFSTTSNDDNSNLPVTEVDLTDMVNNLPDEEVEDVKPDTDTVLIAGRDQEKKLLLDAIASDLAKTGSLPMKSECIGTTEGNEEDYLDQAIPLVGKVEDHYVEIGAYLEYLDDTLLICNGPVYQYLGGNNYAIYIALESDVNGNSDSFIGSQSEVDSYQESLSGKYYMILKNNGEDISNETTTTVETETPVKRPKVKVKR